MKKIALVLLTVLLAAALAAANGSNQNEIAEGKAIVENKTDCSELGDEQLEAVGEYLMEQMHPGEAHEAMHKAMGIEEGTEQHNQIHISMAKAMYCNEGVMTGCGMMGMMGSGMMNMMGDAGNSGMMGMMNMMSMMGNMGSGMMGDTEHSQMHGSEGGSMTGMMPMVSDAEHGDMHSGMMDDAEHSQMHSGMMGMAGMMNNADGIASGNWMQNMMQMPIGSLGIGHWNLLKVIYMVFIG